MTREEARKILTMWMVSSRGADGQRGYIEGWFDKDDVEAFSMAIKALSADRQEVESATIHNEGITFSYRKTGEWIWSPKDKDGTVSGCCSNCSFSHLFIGGHTAQYNYCPNCGAKMRGEEE